MAVGGVDLPALQAMVARTDGRVHIAMDNCPHQAVLIGESEAAARAPEGIAAVVSRAIVTRARGSPGGGLFP